MTHFQKLATLCGMALCQSAFSANILIVNGSSTTSETTTTTQITAHLQATCSAGNTFTVSDAAPVSLAAFDQIWDLRFSNVALSPADQSAYVSFLQSGKRMFVMGENAFFVNRNNSIFAMVTALGGGSLTFTTPASTQTVNAPLTGPTPITSVTYNAPGGVTSAGTGSFMTQSGAQGTAVAWATGSLSNAPAGSLTTVFDVNFMQASQGANSTAFLSNLCGFVATGGQPVAAVQVPSSSTWSLLAMLAALGMLGMSALRLSRR
jgi:hypothetical protein